MYLLLTEPSSLSAEPAAQNCCTPRLVLSALVSTDVVHLRSCNSANGEINQLRTLMQGTRLIAPESHTDAGWLQLLLCPFGELQLCALQCQVGDPESWPETWNVQLFRSIDSSSAAGLPKTQDALKMGVSAQTERVVDFSIQVHNIAV